MSVERSFKESFKFYKARFPVPDLSDVLDVATATEETCAPIKLEPCTENPFPRLLKHPAEWQCYEIKDRPGLVFVRNPFTTLGQRYWMVRSIRDYPRAPNAVNLLPKKFEKEVIDDWWRSYSSAKDAAFKKTLKNSMRWATLGYHHDWDTKVYSESMKNEFPKDLAEVTEYLARVLGYGKYSAEAAIVNFYPLGTTLSGHTDHSEANLEAPLFSFSFGQQAIFMLGGTSREHSATAMYLKSGDVVVMSKESRLCYHAVPRVMKEAVEPWLCLDSNENEEMNPPDCKRSKADGNSKILSDLVEDCRDNRFWKPFLDYVNTTRININIRQVLNDGQTCL